MSEEVKVEKQDPIVEGVEEVNGTVSMEEPQEQVVEEEMTEAVDWEQEAKKFQSMYDKKTVELDRLSEDTEQLQQLRGALENNPQLVDSIEKTLVGESQSNEPIQSAEEFDPWDAYHKPESSSYQYRVANEQKLVHDTVDRELAKLKGQMAMNNLKTELVSKHNLNTEDANEFLSFATTPKADLPIESLIKVWKESKGQGAKENVNKKAVERAKSIPKPAGVLQGGDAPQKNESDQVWDRIMGSSSRGRVAK